jgi:hypothetical protein
MKLGIHFSCQGTHRADLSLNGSEAALDEMINRRTQMHADDGEVANPFGN